MMVLLLHTLALMTYLTAGGMAAASFVGGRLAVPRSSGGVLAGAVVVHALALFVFALQFEELPLVGLAPTLSTLAFLMAVFLIALMAVRDAQPLSLVGVPLIAALLGAALVIGIAPSGEILAFRGIWFAVHVVLAFVGYAGFAMAFAAGLLFLLQFRELKSKRFGRIFNFMPPLTTLDRLGRAAAGIGFAALGSALLIGWAWTVRFRHTLALGDPKVLWGVLTWVLLGIVLLFHGRRLGSERRGAQASVVGFAVVVLFYVAVRFWFVGGKVFL
jgi:HemX protein